MSVGTEHVKRNRDSTNGVDRPLLSVDEAAAYLGVSSGTLRNWLSCRRLAFVKVGRLTRLSRETLERYVADHTVHAIEDSL